MSKERSELIEALVDQIVKKNKDDSEIFKNWIRGILNIKPLSELKQLKEKYLK